MTFGGRILQLRLENNLTQVQLAKATGTTKQNIYQIEVGNNYPGTRLMVAIADYFQVSLDYLFGRTDQRAMIV